MILPYRIDAPIEVIESKSYDIADPSISRTFRDKDERLYGFISLCQNNKFPKIGNFGCHILELYLSPDLNLETIYYSLDVSFYDLWIDMRPNIINYHWIDKKSPNSEIVKQFFIDCDFGEFIERNNCYILKLDYVNH